MFTMDVKQQHNNSNFEVLRLIGAVLGTASVIQTINKFSLYGHLLPIKEKQLLRSF